MRAFLIIPSLVIIPFLGIAALKAVTGDALSALVFALLLFVTVAAWFSGVSASARRAARRS